MAWVRIHDGALSHPKIVGMVDTRRPFDLWVWGLSYAQLHLTDGMIPNDAVPRGAAKAVQDLCRRGLWEAKQEGFVIHDHLEWNDSRELVKTRRQAAEAEKMAHRERMKQWRDKKKLLQEAYIDADCDTSRDTSQDGHDVTHGDVSMPLLTKPNQTKPYVQEKIHRERDARMTGTSDPALARRAGEFFKSWTTLYSRHRSGAVYHSRPHVDYANCCNLVRSFSDDQRLCDLAVVFLNSNEPFIEGSNRSLAVFETRISWCDEQLRKAEAQQRRSA